MNACSKDIADYLEEISALGLTQAENLWIGKEPVTPNNTVTIYDTPGAPPMLTFNQGENYFYDSIQIRIRNAKYTPGYALAHLIMTTLHGLGQQTINGTLYTVINCTSGPAMLGWDDKGRVLFVVNFDIQRR